MQGISFVDDLMDRLAFCSRREMEVMDFEAMQIARTGTMTALMWAYISPEVFQSQNCSRIALRSDRWICGLSTT